MVKAMTVAKNNDLPAGKTMAVDFEGKKIALFNINGTYYAVNDECTHAGGSLSEGEIEGTVVTCPWHGATFDVTNGAVLGAPAYEDVSSYKVFVEGEDIKIETP